MDKTITVVGSGVAYAMPDTAVVNGEIVGTVADYSEAVRSSAEAITTIRKSIGEAGFDMDDLRTTSFSVDTVYRNGSSGTVEFSGYRYMHGISISTDADGESLGRLLQALTSCEQAPEFRVSYVVRDPSGPMRDARLAAVKDAKHRARELAAAADGWSRRCPSTRSPRTPSSAIRSPSSGRSSDPACRTLHIPRRRG